MCGIDSIGKTLLTNKATKVMLKAMVLINTEQWTSDQHFNCKYSKLFS